MCTFQNAKTYVTSIIIHHGPHPRVTCIGSLGPSRCIGVGWLRPVCYVTLYVNHHPSFLYPDRERKGKERSRLDSHSSSLKKARAGSKSQERAGQVQTLSKTASSRAWYHGRVVVELVGAPLSSSYFIGAVCGRQHTGQEYTPDSNQRFEALRIHSTKGKTRRDQASFLDWGGEHRLHQPPPDARPVVCARPPQWRSFRRF